MKAFVVNRRRTAPAPWEVDVESSVRDRLYGPRAEVTGLGAIASRLLSVEAGGPASVSELRERLLEARGGPPQLRAA